MTFDDSILDHIEPDLSARITSRRDLFASVRNKLGAAVAAPVLLAAVSTQAFSQGVPKQVQDVLNFALTLEYLEDEFYRTALEKGVVPRNHMAVFSQISMSQH